MKRETSALLLLAEKVGRIEQALGTLIIWSAQSAGSPISISEAEQLLRVLKGFSEKP